MTRDPLKPYTPNYKPLPTEPIDTHHMIIEFGKHRGERWTRLPLDYLRFLINSMDDCYERRVAEAEMKRRGDTMPKTVMISNHAIDRASLKTIRTWESDRKKDEGLYSWLSRIAEEAYQKANGAKKVKYKGMIFVFAEGNHFPTLKTVMIDK